MPPYHLKDDARMGLDIQILQVSIYNHHSLLYHVSLRWKNTAGIESMKSICSLRNVSGIIEVLSPFSWMIRWFLVV